MSPTGSHPATRQDHGTPGPSNATNKSHPLRVVPVRLAGCEGVVPTVRPGWPAPRPSPWSCLSSGRWPLPRWRRGLTGLAGTQRYGLEHAAAGEGVQMPGKRHDGEPVCGCHQGDVRCVALTVGQLSQERVRELAEEIWAGSTGEMLPAGPMPDPRRSRPGASAQAAYRRHRQLEREAWRPRWAWRAGAACAAAVAAGVLIGVTMGAWLGWRAALLVGLLTGWRLRFRPSARARVWRRQAALQRRTAGVLVALEHEGYLVLHDITLPGWPASLDHLVVGATGAWVVKSWQPGWLPLPKSTSR